MKRKIIQIAALLAIMVEISSCQLHHVHTDRRYYGHGRVRTAGRYW